MDPICPGEGSKRSRRRTQGERVLPTVPMWRTLVLVQVSDSGMVVWWSLVLVLAAEPRGLVLVLVLMLVSQRVLGLMLGWLLE